MAEMERLDVSGDLEAYYAARLRAWQDEYRAEGRAQGIEQGLAAERDLLRRLAARKFGAGTAERLAGLLAKIGDTRRLAEVGGLDYRLCDGRRSDCPLRQRRRVRSVTPLHLPESPALVLEPRVSGFRARSGPRPPSIVDTHGEVAGLALAAEHHRDETVTRRYRSR